MVGLGHLTKLGKLALFLNYVLLYPHCLPVGTTGMTLPMGLAGQAGGETGPVQCSAWGLAVTGWWVGE